MSAVDWSVRLRVVYVDDSVGYEHIIVPAPTEAQAMRNAEARAYRCVLNADLMRYADAVSAEEVAR